MKDYIEIDMAKGQVYIPLDDSENADGIVAQCTALKFGYDKLYTERRKRPRCKERPALGR